MYKRIYLECWGLNSPSSSSQLYTHDLATFVSDVHAMYLRIAHCRFHSNKVGISIPLTLNHQFPPSPRSVSFRLVIGFLLPLHFFSESQHCPLKLYLILFVKLTLPNQWNLQ